MHKLQFIEQIVFMICSFFDIIIEKKQIVICRTDRSGKYVKMV